MEVWTLPQMSSCWWKRSPRPLFSTSLMSSWSSSWDHHFTRHGHHVRIKPSPCFFQAIVLINGYGYIMIYPYNVIQVLFWNLNLRFLILIYMLHAYRIPTIQLFQQKKDHIISRILRMRLEPPILFHREGVWILTGMMPALRALHPQPWSPDTWMISNLGLTITGLTIHSLYNEEDILAILKIYGTSRLCLEYLSIYHDIPKSVVLLFN